MTEITKSRLRSLIKIGYFEPSLKFLDLPDGHGISAAQTLNICIQIEMSEKMTGQFWHSIDNSTFIFLRQNDFSFTDG